MIGMFEFDDHDQLPVELLISKLILGMTESCFVSLLCLFLAFACLVCFMVSWFSLASVLWSTALAGALIIMVCLILYVSG